MPKRGRRRTRAFHRRVGVLYRPIFGLPSRSRLNYVLDGGEDAPLTGRARVVFRCGLAFVVVAGVALIIWVRP